MEHNLAELGEIKATIETMIKVQGTGLSMPLNKNLLKAKRAERPKKKELEEFQKLYLKKYSSNNNEPGKFLAKVNIVGGYQHTVFKKDDAGELIPFDPARKTLENEHWLEYLDTQSKEYQEGYKQILEEKINIDWHKLSKEVFEKAVEEKLFDGIDYTALFGVLIDED